MKLSAEDTPTRIHQPLIAELEQAADSAWKSWQEALQDQQLDVGILAPDLAQQARLVWSCSEFCTQLCIRSPARLLDLVDSGDLQSTYDPERYARYISAALDETNDEEQLKRILREIRHREMLRIAWRDLAGLAGLDETLADLSRFADAAVDAALNWLYLDQVKQWGTPSDDHGEAQKMAIIAMGKLGACELNFSSDIDLIFAFGSSGTTRGARRERSNEEFFIRLSKRLIQALDSQTSDGFVFRVDMRLRPFGSSGPVATSLDSMEAYYQQHGRDWERYAWIKARVCAGDTATGADLMQRLKPFVFRRYLDFGAFDALRDMHGMIRAEVEKKGLAQHVKLGPGGIREIEFLAQSYQLIRGGREPVFQEPRVQKVLLLLADAGHLQAEAVAELLAAYRFLRNTEHRLQEWKDRQTHELPMDPVGQARIAAAMGFPDWGAFIQVLDRHRQRVSRQFETIAGVRDKQHSDQDQLALVWLQSVAAQDQDAILRQAGFSDPAAAQDALTRLRESHQVRAMSAEGRLRLDKLMPLLLGALAASKHNVTATGRVMEIINAVARRSVYLVLLSEYEVAREVLVRLCGLSPLIAHSIRRQPLLLDELLDPRTLYSPPAEEALEQELDALYQVAQDDEERQLDALRQFKQASLLRVAAADITEAIQVMEVSDHLTAIAEIILRRATQMAWDALIPRHGIPRYTDQHGQQQSAAFAVVAYGKLGGFELSYGSDLDIIFLHNSQGSDQQTDGDKTLENAVFFTRLAKRVVHILTALTRSGTLYEVDLRLRPSGESGMMVSSIDAFEEYQQHNAWTWEHQALVRARVLLGDSRIRLRFDQVRGQVLTRERDPGLLRQEVSEMRSRMRTQLSKTGPDEFNIKQDFGGIADIEFIVQYLMLISSRAHPQLLAYTGNVYSLQAFARLDVLPDATATALVDAYQTMRQQIHRCALQEIPAVVSSGKLEQPRQAVRQVWAEIFGVA